MMTLEQALAFKIAGKQLWHMSEDDWRQWLRRTRAEYRMLRETDDRDISPKWISTFMPQPIGLTM
jgi:hypothetical protein